MNKKDMAQIRRRLNPDRNSINVVKGCFVNDQKEPISFFSLPMINMGKEDKELYMQLFKKLFSGMEGQNLVCPEFTPEQVMDGAEHHTLMALRDTGLKDDSTVEYLYQKIREQYECEGNYVILLLHDTYDVPRHHADGTVQEDAETNLFSYFLCAICPVKLQQGGLSYRAEDNAFHAGDGSFVVSAPECGFMFPAYEDGGANIYRALYYTKDISASRDNLTDALFGTPVPPPAKEQKQVMGEMLSESLGEECTCEVVQAVQDKVIRTIENKKQERDPEPARISLSDMTETLAACGVSEDGVRAFREQYEETIGLTNTVPAVNIAPPRTFEMKAPDVTIRVAPGRSDLVGTRVIDGRKYIVILAEEGVQVNGINVSINS